MAIVQSLTQLTGAPDLESYKTALSGRISALARVQSSLASRRWENGSVLDVVNEALAALCPNDNVHVDGPDVVLVAEHVQPVSMIIHELATNANIQGGVHRRSGRA